MALPPIPRSILRQSISLLVCSGKDLWQKPEYREIPVERVHLQPSASARRTKDNTEVLLRSMLFADAKRSIPALDWWELQQESLAKGAPARVQTDFDSFEVATVERLPDDRGNLHHWEVGLI